MGVLPAVFADTRKISLDVAGIMRGAIEGRPEQQNHLCLPPQELPSYRFHGLSRPPRLSPRRQDGPRLRQRIDLALLVLRGPEWCAVVEVGATIPSAVPRQL